MTVHARLGVALAIVALGSATAGCKQSRTPDLVMPKIEPVSEADAADFGAKLAKTLEACSPDELKQLVDVDVVGIQAAIHAKQRVPFAKEVAAGIGDAIVQLCKQLGNNARVSVLRVRTEEQKVEILVRILHDEGFDYHAYRVGRVGGRVRAYDILYFSAGVRLSEMSKQMAVAFGDVGADSARGKRIEMALERSSALASEGRAKEARAQLAALPVELRNLKAFELRDLALAAQVGEEAHVAAIESYKKRFADDPSLPVVLLGEYFQREMWTEARAAIDILDRNIGGDPYLDSVRADTYLSEGKLDQAEALYRKSLVGVDTADARWGLVQVFLGRKAHKDVAGELRVLLSRGETDLPSLRGSEDYAEFFASPEGKAFIAAREKSQ